MSENQFLPWTPDGATRLQAAASALAAAVSAHAAAVTAVKTHDGIAEVFAAEDGLLPAVLAYADAQFDYTGNSFPFGFLHNLVDDVDDEEKPDEEQQPSTGISVIQRHDYRVTDDAAVLSAGRRAYLRVWPEDDENAANADVTHLGRALYQIAHAYGWESLGDVEGLRPTGACVIVVSRDDTLGPDPDEWPDDLFGVDGEQLYEQRDVHFA